VRAKAWVEQKKAEMLRGEALKGLSVLKNSDRREEAG
jgi:hypothetical protein